MMQAESAHNLVAAVYFLRCPIRAKDRVSERVVAIACSEDRPAEMRDTPDPLGGQGNKTSIGIFLWRQDAVKSIADSVHFPTALHGGKCRRTNDCIQTRGIATA